MSNWVQDIDGDFVNLDHMELVFISYTHEDNDHPFTVVCRNSDIAYDLAIFRTREEACDYIKRIVL